MDWLQEDVDGWLRASWDGVEVGGALRHRPVPDPRPRRLGSGASVGVGVGVCCSRPSVISESDRPGTLFAVATRENWGLRGIKPLILKSVQLDMFRGRLMLEIIPLGYYLHDSLN